MRRSPTRHTIAVIAALAAASAFVACGDSDDSERRDTADIPPQAVAIVGDQPISERAVEQRVAAAGRRASAKVAREQQRQQALSLLIQEAALEQEAEQRGVEVSEAEVRRRLAQARKQFTDRQAFERFLGGASREHLLFQLRLQLLSERVAAATAEDGGDPKRFMQEFQERWSERTACRDETAAPGCAPPPKPE
jgi:hypothetical protein